MNISDLYEQGGGSRTTGVVYLVGAGPGDPDLITVRGAELLAQADVVLHDRLIPHQLLLRCRPSAVIINVGKSPGHVAKSQAEINELLVEHARQGRRVVRLKGGDPFVFGRGMEEWLACAEAGVACEIVPGVSSALAAPAGVGVPVTHRDLARSFAVVTGHTRENGDLPPHDYAALARVDTLCLMMARANLRPMAAALIQHGRSGDTPAAAIASGTTAQQRVVAATLASIADEVDAADLHAPVVTVIGETAVFAARAANSTPASDRAREQHPLAGRRLILTQAIASTSELRAQLRAAGADLLDVPLIEITYPDGGCALDAHLSSLNSFDWIVLTSVHGVRGFWRRLERAGLDARALHGCRVAAVGPGTARELAAYGIHADLIPSTHAAIGLLAAFHQRYGESERAECHERGDDDERHQCSEPGEGNGNHLGDEGHDHGSLRGQRFLYPHGSQALPTLANGLWAAGAEVSAAVVYDTSPTTPDAYSQAMLQDHGDAILFCSPSAVFSYQRLHLGPPRAKVACIGPTTAAAAREAGYDVAIEPASPGTAGLVQALAEFFAQPSAVPST
jgi:uroporphyrinogen III methyltransferase/synthase